MLQRQTFDLACYIPNKKNTYTCSFSISLLYPNYSLVAWYCVCRDWQCVKWSIIVVDCAHRDVHLSLEPLILFVSDCQTTQPPASSS